MYDRAIKFLGLQTWLEWVVEPADRAGCPPGKLLPDPPELPPGVIQRTLVLGMEDTLIFTEWERKRGHRTKKRPDLEAFLAHMSQYYEIVIFTTAMSSYGMPIAQTLQDLGYVQHALFRENCKYMNGHNIKDLSYLNRDLRHVILVDTDCTSYANQPENAIAIKPWHGDLEDVELMELVPFLEAVFKEDVQDVREVLRHFEGVNVPDKFREMKQQALERKKKGGSTLISRTRAPPGVLPVLSNLAPREPVKSVIPSAIPTPAPASVAKEEKQEEKKEEKMEEKKDDRPKNVFQLAKQNKI